MKKRKGIFYGCLVLSFIFLLVGCDSEKLNLLDDPEYYVKVSLEARSGKAKFRANSYNSDDDPSLLNNAVVTINGVKLELDPDGDGAFFDGILWCESNDLILSTGEEVKIVISHPLLGDIEKTFLVPPGPDNLRTLNSGETIADYIKGNIPSITMTWDENDSDLYYAGFWTYFSETYYIGHIHGERENTTTFNFEDLNDRRNDDTTYIFDVYGAVFKNFRTSFGMIEFSIKSHDCSQIYYPDQPET